MYNETLIEASPYAEGAPSRGQHLPEGLGLCGKARPSKRSTQEKEVPSSMCIWSESLGNEESRAQGGCIP